MAREKDKKGAPSAPDAPTPAGVSVTMQLEDVDPDATFVALKARLEAPPAPAVPSPPARYKVLRRITASLPGQGFTVLNVGAEVSAESHGAVALAALLEAGCPLERLPD